MKKQQIFKFLKFLKMAQDFFLCHTQQSSATLFGLLRKVSKLRLLARISTTCLLRKFYPSYMSQQWVPIARILSNQILPLRVSTPCLPHTQLCCARVSTSCLRRESQIFPSSLSQHYVPLSRILSNQINSIMLFTYNFFYEKVKKQENATSIPIQNMFVNFDDIKATKNITLTSCYRKIYLQNKTPFLFHSLRLNHSLTKNANTSPPLAGLEAIPYKRPLKDELELALSGADSVFHDKYVASRTKIGLVLLHLTGLRVSNLLRWSVKNLRELQDSGETRIKIPNHKSANHKRKEVSSKIEEAHSENFSKKQQVRFQHLLGTPFYVHSVLEKVFPNAERRIKRSKQTGIHTSSREYRGIQLSEVETSYREIDEAQKEFPCSHRLIKLNPEERKILASIKTDILMLLNNKQSSTCALFTSKSNPDSSIPISRELFTRQLNKAYKKNQTKTVRGGTHNFRVGYILELLESEDLETVKDKICHADIKTTFEYKLKKCL